ncbi:MAG: hypothetical protein M0P26_06885 [Bacteroidales bacterium]|nr:hypothetical protein [Bacteroidales bacterium]MDD4394070.1 hypothetical protein [Desulfobacterales bacterium]
MLDIISDNVMIVLVMGIITLTLTCLPIILNYLKEERKEKQAEIERKRESEARRNREEDISTLLGNVLKTDTVMDYVMSRGSNKEGNEREPNGSNYDKVVELVKATSNKE